MATVKKKKFKDLLAGDIVYYLYKPVAQEGIVELTLKNPLVLESNRMYYSSEVEERYQNVSIESDKIGKSVVSTRYVVYATSREDVIKASRKFIESEISKYDKQIEKLERSIEYSKQIRLKLQELITEEK